MKNRLILLLIVVFAAHGSSFAKDARHDLNLGATGVRGWNRCDKMVTSDAREITVTKVEKASPADGDPRGMQQRYLSFALFDRNGMLGRSLEGVARPSLYKAVRAGLRNEDGRARGSIGSVYRRLSLEEIKPLLPAILEAIVQPAPSGEMFADEIRVEDLRLLSQHHNEEGMNALVIYTRDQNPGESVPLSCTYGTHAKTVIPELSKIANYFEKDEKVFPMNAEIRVK